MSRTTMPKRRSEASRRAILNAALALVSEVGYPRLSIEGIAARAGVGKQTIYRWWPSKGAVLFDAILLQSEDQDSNTELPDTGHHEADLKTVLRATVHEFLNPAFDHLLRALTTEIIHDPELAALYVERLDAPMKALKKKTAKTRSSTGQLAPDLDLDLAIELIWAPLSQRWLLRSGPLNETYANELVELALKALKRV